VKIFSLALTGVTLTALAVLPAGAASATSPARPHDFNGDGRTDLVVNGPDLAKRGLPWTGLVAILYSGGREQVITRDSPSVPSSAGRGDRFGESTASADFDRDGYADLAVTGFKEGGVIIVYGSRKGLSRRSAFLRTSTSYRLIFKSLATGDFNGDGRADLIATVQSRYWIFYGVGEGKPRTTRFGSTADPDQDAGYALVPTAADFTGDGRTDVALSDMRSGSFLLKSTKKELTAPIPVSGGLPSPQISASGDLNGDGKADLVVSDAERVQVLLGRSSGFGKPKTITSRTLGRPAAYSFGHSLAIADVNRDGRADLAIGAPAMGPKGSGQVFLLYGHRSGLTTRKAQTFDQKNKALKVSPEKGDLFGSAVRLLNLSGDGRPELVIGSGGEDKGTGRVYVLANRKGRITAKSVKKYRPKDFGLAGRGLGTLLDP